MVNLGYSLVAYGVMLVVFQVPLRWTLAYLPVVVACLFLFALGISYLLSAAYVFFGDIKHLYSVALTLWMYCSGHLLPGGPALRVHPSGGWRLTPCTCTSAACGAR